MEHIAESIHHDRDELEAKNQNYRQKKFRKQLKQQEYGRTGASAYKNIKIASSKSSKLRQNIPSA